MPARRVDSDDDNHDEIGYDVGVLELERAAWRERQLELGMENVLGDIHMESSKNDVHDRQHEYKNK